MYKPASAPSARSASPRLRVGVFIIASPACWAARTASRSVPYFIQSATTGFIASIFPSRHRVSPKQAFEGPEPYDGTLSRPVLRGLAPSKWGLGYSVLGIYHHLTRRLSAGWRLRQLPFQGRASLSKCASAFCNSVSFGKMRLPLRRMDRADFISPRTTYTPARDLKIVASASGKKRTTDSKC